IFMNSKFDRDELAREKLVVLQEIKMVEDTPDDLIHDIFAESFWKGHPIGRSILGSKKNIESISRAEILGYFKEHYGSGRVFITAAGGLKHGRVLSLIKKTFGRMEPGPGKTAATVPHATSGVRLIKKDLEQVHICLGVSAPAQSHPDRYKVYLLNSILGSGMSSRLFQEIREKRGLAYSVYSYLNLCKDAGSLVVYAGTSRDSFTEVVGLILKEFKKLRKGVMKDELVNAKEQLKGGMLLGLETSDSRMTKLARDEIYFGKAVPVKEIVKGIDGVTMRDMEAVCGRLLTPDRVAMVAMGRVVGRGLPKELKGAR
ncbi:MAG: pitrilysin family protein, partial [Deltaproteobacteria bacterium]